MLAIVAIGAVLIGVVIAMINSGEEEVQGYRVRAIFDNAASLVKQSDIRVAGATVGEIEQLTVSSGDKASIVMNITDPAFQKFYEDASCEIRLQSLIGEKFIDCNPGTPGKPELQTDPTDDARRYMIMSQTISPVDLDLNFNVLRMPTRERLRLIINEFGAALAGRGEDLNKAIKNSNPSLYEFDKVLDILADNNKLLGRLAKDGDTSLVALARERKHITGLLRNANEVQKAVNSRQEELRATWRKLPAFFDQLEPTARELKELSIKAQPISAALNKSGKDLSTFITETPGFAKDANRGLKRFSEATSTLQSYFPVLTPLATDLKAFGSYKSTELNAKKLLQSFEKQDGYKNLMTLTIGIVGALNGYDSYGHFVRSALIVSGTCISVSNIRNRDCPAGDFGKDRKYQDTPDGIKDVSQIDSSDSASSSDAGTAALDYLLGSGN